MKVPLPLYHYNPPVRKIKLRLQSDGLFRLALEQPLATQVRSIQMPTSGQQSQATPKVERSGLKRQINKSKLSCWRGPGLLLQPFGQPGLFSHRNGYPLSGWPLPGLEHKGNGSSGHSSSYCPGLLFFRLPPKALQQHLSDHGRRGIHSRNFVAVW